MTRPVFKPKDNLPPVVSREHAPGYMRFQELEIWVWVEDFTLIFDVYDELKQDEFKGRRHGTRHLKTLGCKGPLCNKAQRDYVRANTPAAASPYRRRWERYDELLELLTKHHYSLLSVAST